MNTLLILYEEGPLGFLGQEQQQITSYIQSSGTWAKVSKNVWLIKTTSNATQVRDALRTIFSTSLTGRSGTILVIDVTKANWASYNFIPQVTEWMRTNI